MGRYRPQAPVIYLPINAISGSGPSSSWTRCASGPTTCWSTSVRGFHRYSTSNQKPCWMRDALSGPLIMRCCASQKSATLAGTTAWTSTSPPLLLSIRGQDTALASAVSNATPKWVSPFTKDIPFTSSFSFLSRVKARRRS